MNEKERNEIVAMLNSLVDTLYYTSVGGNCKGNHIIRFDLIERSESEYNEWGGLLDKGTFVRPVWSRNPDRKDGYYDINVSGNSVNGVFYDVTKWLTKNYI